MGGMGGFVYANESIFRFCGYVSLCATAYLFEALTPRVQPVPFRV